MTKCDRLLDAIFATVVEDGLAPRNPCVIKGASVGRPKERPITTIEQVYALADAIASRWRAMILLAMFRQRHEPPSRRELAHGPTAVVAASVHSVS